MWDATNRLPNGVNCVNSKSHPKDVLHVIDCSETKAVDLSSNSLQEISDGSLVSLKEIINLNLSSNPKLQKIPAELNTLQHLANLYMSGCGITSLQDTSLSRTNLEQLDLSNNHIVTLGKHSLSGIPAVLISKIKLDNNSLASILESSGFAEICSANEGQAVFEFGNYNNFRCDCDLVWLRNYPNCLQGQDKSIVCSSCPDDNQGDCTKSIIKFRANNCTNWHRVILFATVGGSVVVVILVVVVVVAVRRRRRRRNRKNEGDTVTRSNENLERCADGSEAPLLSGRARRVVADTKMRSERSATARKDDADMSLDDELRRFLVSYRCLKRRAVIGEGGYGIVYRAKWNNYTVAVKKLRVPNECLLDNEKEEFKREAFMMSKLHHPNIVLLMGVCLEERKTCIVTEYMERGSVAKILRVGNMTLETSRVHQMLLDVAKGMAYLHSQDPPIIHRDLKSSNLLVDRKWTVKVGDFGVAKILTRLSRADTKLPGSVRWTAPELLVDRPSLTEKADVYSFGIVTWEFTDPPHIPFNDFQRDQEVVNAVLKGTRPRISENCYLDSLRGVIESCWHGDPAQRPEFDDIVTQLKQTSSADTVSHMSLTSDTLESSSNSD
ncbi:probable serine/threonine-protein kinase drkC isoform X2 [Corticium candelabrum]|uniref:probable serine/threonine-protein kinase drkC isoform X2 n=1 Tax=Corticium candelabrum TaxID=121492 RepID=UPI002E277154|nr:probable serine/threonine-protein kinase drkC isoform X2 [Corticium candelabrum]XP_062514406.1 probable serine/threonine-protein kinase drkC isoform X2 [Corticium candelabrum]